MSRERAKHLRVRLEPAPSASVRPGDHRARRHGKFQMLEEHARHVGGGRDGRSRARARLRRRVREEGFDLRATTVRLPKLATQRFGRERHPARLHRRENRHEGHLRLLERGYDSRRLRRRPRAKRDIRRERDSGGERRSCGRGVRPVRREPAEFPSSRLANRLFVQITLERARDVLRLVPRAARAARECRRFRSKNPRGDANVYHGRRDDPRQRAVRRAHRAKLRFEIDGHLSRTGGGEDRAHRLPSEPAPSRIP